VSLRQLIEGILKSRVANPEDALLSQIGLEASTPTWIAPTLLNDWENYESTYAASGYYKDPLGRVHLRGTVKHGTPAETIFVLPAGYRPSAWIVFPASIGAENTGLTDTKPGRVDITDAGLVQATVVNSHSSDSDNWISLDGISFLAEQ
jgi:hypothetical protein